MKTRVSSAADQAPAMHDPKPQRFENSPTAQPHSPRGEPPLPFAKRPTWSVAGKQVFAADPRPRRPLLDYSIDRSMAEFPGLFASREEAQQLLARICLPASERWAFAATPKAATTTTLALLFTAEFGVPFTPRLQLPENPNPDQAAHALIESDVFEKAWKLPRSLRDIAHDENVERIAVVRHPEDRAISSFEYLCKSNEQKRLYFQKERALISILFDFDFESHPGTSRGFVLFLEYLKACLRQAPMDLINPHWRPQASLVFPTAFQPTLIGKVENYEAFRCELFSRLDCPLPDENIALNASRKSSHAREALLCDPAARGLIREIFEADFELFGYEPR